MRAGPCGRRAVGVALVLTAACTGGDGGSLPAPSTAPSTMSKGPSTSITLTPTTGPAGSVTLRAAGITLPDIRSGGPGLRVLVRAASPRLTVHRRGGGGPVTACPVAGPTAPVSTGECVALGPDSVVDIGFIGGVELRATEADTGVEEVGVTYLPAARTTTLVTPARPAGACAARPCEATFSFLPARAGAFVLDGRPAGGRPRLVLTSTGVAGTPSSNRTLATAEGGGSLSIRATLEAGSEARLLHHQQGADAIAPLTAEILWP